MKPIEPVKKAGGLMYVCSLIMAILLISLEPVNASESEEITFVIFSFSIEGNTLLEKMPMIDALEEFTGDGKTAEDVELARDALERLYHESGYPAVLVNIPEQTVDSGVIRFEVIESRIKRVHVKGNKYFTMAYIKEKLPAIQPGKILYLPKVRDELSDINRIPDLKVAPLLIPGRELGTIDVELDVEDQLPLHGSLELNNRTTHTTSELRLNGMIRYDNLWQRGHSLSAQFQTSPQDTQDVRMFSTSYAMPTPWEKNHLLIGYYINSDSDTASGEGINVIGTGQIAGFRYMVMLPGLPSYSHSLTMGFDWKDFEENTEGDIVPIEYMPFSFGYVSTLSGRTGATQFSADLNFLFRDVFFSDMNEFQAKRFGATGNYIYLTAGAERRQSLPKGFSLFAKLDGQIADQPLVNNEQFSAGGVNSVRGYKESEMMGDNAFHGTLELFSPSLWKKHPLVPYLFYDWAWMDVREPLAGEADGGFIHGIGLGLQGAKGKFEYKLDWGLALEDTGDTDAGDHHLYFRLSYRF